MNMIVSKMIDSLDSLDERTKKTRVEGGNTYRREEVGLMME